MPQEVRRRLEAASRYAKKAVVTQHVRDSLDHSFTARSATMTAWKQALVFSATVACLLACNVARADVDLHVVRDYPAGTAATAQIHSWLLQQSRLKTQPRQIAPPASAADLGAIRISTALFDRPLGTRTDAAGEAAPLPVRGQPRDEVTIDACNAGQRYRWVYEWQQTPAAAWQLRSYHQKSVADCKAPLDEPMPSGTHTTTR
ncbi:hypothetical protein VC279_20420 [Xanthomonas sp. WHRI 10064A]|uniref:hypothetical protein n=1 Tax=unclassified Xanthomonas TaxID=2643310 RepID=UPI002B234C1D|nr:MULTISPECIES: hypothetical protein [unclassified Xanthomonas]MEA9589680.1 hypothetical protein [Xanthomonas sp. WHRI 10064B]MEA9616969.1 hypothetical protein [Xanthomonas sp. WHRI 10064A]